MFKIWLSKVETILQRALQPSEIKTAEKLYFGKYTPAGAAEYIG